MQCNQRWLLDTLLTCPKTTTTGATSKKRRRGNANKTTKASQGDDDDKEVGNRLMAMNDRLLKTVLDFFLPKSAPLSHPERGTTNDDGTGGQVLTGIAGNFQLNFGVLEAEHINNERRLFASPIVPPFV
jgi:hypothetical protein